MVLNTFIHRDKWYNFKLFFLFFLELLQVPPQELGFPARICQCCHEGTHVAQRQRGGRGQLRLEWQKHKHGGQERQLLCKIKFKLIQVYISRFKGQIFFWFIRLVWDFSGAHERAGVEGEENQWHPGLGGQTGQGWTPWQADSRGELIVFRSQT